MKNSIKNLESKVVTNVTSIKGGDDSAGYGDIVRAPSSPGTRHEFPN